MSNGADRPGGAVHALLAMAAFVIIVAGMRAASTILVPFLLSIFIAVIAAPAFIWMRRRHVPSAVALLLMVSALVILGIGIVGLVGSGLNDFTQRLPEYQTLLETKTAEFIQWLKSKGIETPDRLATEVLDPKAAMSFVGNLVSSLSSLVSNSFLIILTVTFILLEATGFAVKLRALPSWTAVEMQASSTGFASRPA